MSSAGATRPDLNINQKVKTRFLKRELPLSRRQMLIFATVFGMIGGVIIWRALAAPEVVATVQAENMTLSANATVIDDTSASAGKAIKLSAIGSSASSPVVLPSNADSLVIRSRTDSCNKKIRPYAKVLLDGSTVLSVRIGSGSWSGYTLAKSIPSGTHSLSVQFEKISRQSSCMPKLYLDVVTFYGPTTITPPPTVSFSGSPASIITGQSSTLTWYSTDASSCTASGGWSGTKPTSGSESTGALNTSTTYNLSCTGGGGTISVSATVNVQPLTGSNLPKQGISTGYTILNRTASARKFELDKIVRALNGKPGFVRFDSTSGNQAQVDAVMTDVLARGLEPMLILYGSTGSRSADTFGRDQAVKWLDKVKYFEICNEPDLHSWTPDAYADFVKATASSIRSANPNAVIIAGALWKGGAGPQAFTRALATRAKGSFDILSMHLYDDPKVRASWNTWDMAFPVLFGSNSYFKGNTVREILDANGLSSVPIISTESGGPVDKYGEDGQNKIIANDFDALNSNLLPSLLVYTMINEVD